MAGSANGGKGRQVAAAWRPLASIKATARNRVNKAMRQYNKAADAEAHSASIRAGRPAIP
jgi:outer membrane murein-binding lipoprotein Lpp